MPALNPFFALQRRIAALLEANAYFTGLTATGQILTEEIGDLEFVVMNKLLPLSFGVVVTTAAGKARENEYEVLMTDEDLNVSIMWNPTTDPKHKMLDAVAAAIAALQNQFVQETPPPAPRPFDYFRITGHQKRLDGPPGVNVHEIYVLAGLRLS
ncbi:MAG TPA: hypothetical protein VGG34_01470 [Opitutaceae bacterium]|jgi:hypothetical protein